MAFFGLGPKKGHTKSKLTQTRPQGANAPVAESSKGKKTAASHQTNKSANALPAVEGIIPHRNAYAPVTRTPGDAAFLSPMGDVNQPTAVYQQHLARQWQHKAAERAEMRESAAHEEQMMLAAQSAAKKTDPSKKQWPIMPLEFQIEHSDITNVRYHTMFRHLGIGKDFFESVVEAYVASSKVYQRENKKTVKHFRAQDWQAVGDKMANFCNSCLSEKFSLLARVDYKWNEFQRTGKYILTYPLQPEDIIPWCEVHKLPYLNENGLAAWAEHKAKLQSGELTGA